MHLSAKFQAQWATPAIMRPASSPGSHLRRQWPRSLLWPHSFARALLWPPLRLMLWHQSPTSEAPPAAAAPPTEQHGAAAVAVQVQTGGEALLRSKQQSWAPRAPAAAQRLHEGTSSLLLPAWATLTLSLVMVPCLWLLRLSRKRCGFP